MKSANTLLITSIGSGVGVAVLRALRQTRPLLRIVGVGCEAKAAGVYACDAAYLAPPVQQQAEYSARLLEIVRLERPAMLIPGHDAELPLLAELRDRLANDYGVIIPVGTVKAVQACCDKFSSAEAFADLAFARSAATLEDARHLAQETGFPLIVKPRYGYASRGVTVVFTEADLQQAFTVSLEPMVAQEYLADHNLGKAPSQLTANDVYQDGFIRQDIDYSVQVVLGINGQLIGMFASRNRLRFGFPVAVETFYEASLFQAAETMAERLGQLGLVGPCNFQAVWVAPDKFVFFECNARFTGISDSRAALGWNECEAVLRHFLDNRDPGDCLNFQPGLCAFRHWSDTLCTSEDVDRLLNTGAWCKPS